MKPLRHHLKLAACLLAMWGTAEARTPVSIPTPDAKPSTAPGLGPVSAVEMILKDAPRRVTRDAARVAAVIKALGAAAEWTSSGMPRCKPALWARLVPPSGEGGASVTFCRADAPGHISLPGSGAYRLTETASHATYQALAGLADQPPGAVPPKRVTDALGTLTITVVTDKPPGAPATGLRSVALHRGQPREPEGKWPDGTPVSASHALTDAQATAAVEALAHSGFFHRATLHHAPASAITTEAPEGSVATPPPQPAPAPGYIQVTVTLDGWHLTWHEARGPAVHNHTIETLARLPALAAAAADLRALLPEK